MKMSLCVLKKAKLSASLNPDLIGTVLRARVFSINFFASFSTLCDHYQTLPFFLSIPVFLNFSPVILRYIFPNFKSNAQRTV